jgi:hypothetical protein
MDHLKDRRDVEAAVQGGRAVPQRADIANASAPRLSLLQ